MIPSCLCIFTFLTLSYLFKRYSIWLDSKMRLQVDPMLIIEYFLWRKKSEYAISNHYDRHCVWEEVQQNKRLNKYNHTAIDEQFAFYQSDGLVKFDPSDINSGLPSCECSIYFTVEFFIYLRMFYSLAFFLYLFQSRCSRRFLHRPGTYTNVKFIFVSLVQ